MIEDMSDPGPLVGCFLVLVLGGIILLALAWWAFEHLI
jgi:hypothetical protein